VPRIHLLPETLANQIAAGEVIERPAAVVKELVENALDAGARRIEVDLLDGGRKLVRVRDDGSGMGREDARLSLSRHATSKLASKDDLFNIATFGFRGEALPSIAAVSRFTLLTAEADALAGTRIEVAGGQVLSVEDAGAPKGTTATVQDLFFNVPARKKFLKRASTEQSHAVDAVLRLAIPREGVGIVLREGDRTLVRVGQSATVEERAVEALGAGVRGSLLPFEASVRGIRAHGLAASPEFAQGSARGVWLFVNGRFIRDRQLTHAVLRAYGEVIPHGRYPAALVFLEVPPSELDVNVHPAKAEVRLADARGAYEAILKGLVAVLAPGAWLHLRAAAPPAGAHLDGGVERDGVFAGVSGASEGPSEELIRIAAQASGAGGNAGGATAVAAADDASWQYAAGAAAQEHGARVAEALARYGQRAPFPGEAQPGQGRSPRTWSGGHETTFPGTARERQGAQAALIAPQAYFAGLRYLGQLHRTYLVCEGPRGLVLIDQHAAHERMNYQRLRRAAEDQGVLVQPLLVPRMVQLPASSLALLGDAAEALLAAGIEVDSFGGGALAVKALPAPLSGLGERALAALLADLAEELASHGRGESLERIRDALLARAACHGSVRAHDALAPGEAQALLDALDGTDYGARCAHGRPVVAEWITPEIEKRFGRDYETHAHAAPADSL
jgi:DNA mismatch repair protein MutL